MKKEKSFEGGREIGINYKYKEFEINIKTINSFKLLENRRLLRQNHYKKIKRAILEGINFDSPLIVNENKNQKRIIDGQHRYTAIKEILDMFPKFKIKVLLIIYKNLPQDKEEEIFTRYNKGMRQSSDDYVQMYVDKIPILKHLKDSDMEVSIYKTRGKIHFKPLIEAYLYLIKKGRMVITREEFLKACMKLNKDDAKKIKEFIKGYSENIIPSGNSDFQKTTPLQSIFFSWYNKKLSEREFWERLKKDVLQNDKFLMFTRIGGHQATALATETIDDLLDKSKDYDLEDGI